MCTQLSVFVNKLSDLCIFGFWKCLCISGSVCISEGVRVFWDVYVCLVDICVFLDVNVYFWRCLYLSVYFWGYICISGGNLYISYVCIYGGLYISGEGVCVSLV